MYTRAARRVGVVTSALVKTFVTKVMNFVCSGRREADFPRRKGEAGLRPIAKSTVSTTESTTYSKKIIRLFLLEKEQVRAPYR